jgi:hypothetical protein
MILLQLCLVLFAVSAVVAASAVNVREDDGALRLENAVATVRVRAGAVITAGMALAAPLPGDIRDDLFAAAPLSGAPAETPSPDAASAQDAQTIYALILTSSGAARNSALNSALLSLIVRCGLAGLAVFIIGAALTAVWTLPLRRLPRQMSEGAEELRWKDGGRFSFGEAGEMQKSMQELFMSLSIREDEMGASMKRYQRFMPQDIDRLLGRANLMEIEYGDFADGDDAVGIITTSSKDPARFGEDHHMFLEFVFTAFRNIYAAANGSAVFLSNSFSLTDFRLLFPGGGADGVRMGVRLATDTAETPTGAPEPDFLLILHRARYEYGVSGCEDRAVTFMSSYELGLLARISERLSELGVKMLITERCGDSIGRDVSTRYIGYVTSPDESHSIKLYEVLDVYRGGARLTREQSNDKFQEGIRLYYKNDFYLARNIFSEIFKNCPGDGVARWYIFACERLFNRADFSTINHSIFGAD